MYVENYSKFLFLYHSKIKQLNIYTLKFVRNNKNKVSIKTKCRIIELYFAFQISNIKTMEFKCAYKQTF